MNRKRSSVVEENCFIRDDGHRLSRTWLLVCILVKRNGTQTPDSNELPSTIVTLYLLDSFKVLPTHSTQQKMTLYWICGIDL